MKNWDLTESQSQSKVQNAEKNEGFSGCTF